MRLTPAIFWSMSLVEWRAALAGRARRVRQPLARNELEKLMQDHPDHGR